MPLITKVNLGFQPHHMAIILLLTASLSAADFGQADSAAASTPSDQEISIYVSAPFVQGSHVIASGSETIKEDFNSVAVSASGCPSAVAGGAISLSFGGASNCYVAVANENGGATTDSDVATIGGTGTNYMATPWYSSGDEKSITFDFGQPVKYVGLWWSAGNTGNIIRFFDENDTKIAEIDSKDVVDALTLSPVTNWTQYGTATRSVTTFDPSGSHLARYYYDNPQRHTSSTPTSLPRGSNGFFVFTYLNLFVSGDLGISKVQVAGPGFEFDNLAVSTVTQSPQATMVLVSEKTVPTITWNPSTSYTVNQSPATLSSQASASVAGTISYSVSDAGATGCTVDSTTGVLSFTAIGSCSVTATLDPTDSSSNFATSKTVTFNITKLPQTVTWNPATSLLMGGSPVTPSATASALGGATISYAVSSSGTAGCSVNSSTGELAFTGVGSCIIRASAAATAAYEAGFTDVTFTIAEPKGTPRPYEGPLNLKIQAGEICSGGSLFITGERLNTIKTVYIGEQPATHTLLTDGRLQVSLNSVTSGNYQVRYFIPINSLNLTDQIFVGNCSNSKEAASTITTSNFQVRKLFANYRGDRGPVIARDRAAITAFINQYKGITTVRCVGSTSGVPAKRTDPALARARAKNACDIVKTLVPNATYTLETSTGKGVGQRFRSVTIFISGTN